MAIIGMKKTPAEGNFPNRALPVTDDAPSLSALPGYSRFSVIQLAGRGRILAANDRARGLLEQDEGLRDVDGVLRATAPRDHRVLQRLLARAAPPSGAPGSSGSMTITRSSASTRLVVHILPLSARQRESGAGQAAVLVLVADPERRPSIDIGLVQAALGLTPAESRLAALVADGNRVRDIAECTGRSEGTVRWHLNRIFRKQGISGQADLVRRVLSLDGFPRYRPRRTQTNPASIGSHSEPDPSGAPAVEERDGAREAHESALQSDQSTRLGGAAAEPGAEV